MVGDIVTCSTTTDDDGGLTLSITDSRRLVVLMEVPFVVPFEERVKVSNITTFTVYKFIACSSFYG